MAYHFAKTLNVPFDEAVERTVAALKQHGFGVLTRIDVKNTLKEKIGAEFRPYVILGACNPHTRACILGSLSGSSRSRGASWLANMISPEA